MLENNNLIIYGPHIILFCIIVRSALIYYLERFLYKDDNYEEIKIWRVSRSFHQESSFCGPSYCCFYDFCTILSYKFIISIPTIITIYLRAIPDYSQVALFLANITYLSAKRINIHLLSYAVVKIGEMSVWILPYRPKVVKPVMPILDSDEPLMYTMAMKRNFRLKKWDLWCIRRFN